MLLGRRKRTETFSLALTILGPAKSLKSRRRSLLMSLSGNAALHYLSALNKLPNLGARFFPGIYNRADTHNDGSSISAAQKLGPKHH